MIVAIDGPSGAGKSTVSQEVARRLGVALLDTGALYRGAALLAHRKRVKFDDGPAVAALVEAAELTFELEGEAELGHLLIDGEDVGEAIRTPRMSEGASRVSAQPEVRAALLELQRRIGHATSCVVEGRDIGTVVFPDAPFKFFLTANLPARVERRKKQYTGQGKAVSDEEMRREVIERDKRDSERDVAPLKPADDAILLDSTDMNFEEVVMAIIGVVKSREAQVEAEACFAQSEDAEDEKS